MISFDHYITITGVQVKYHQPTIEGIEIDCINNNMVSKLKVFKICIMKVYILSNFLVARLE